MESQAKLFLISYDLINPTCTHDLGDKMRKAYALELWMLTSLYTIGGKCGGEGRLTGPNLNPSGLPAAYHRPGSPMYVMSF